MAVVLSVNLSHLLYAIYLSGNGAEFGRSATVDSQGIFIWAVRQIRVIGLRRTPFSLHTEAAVML
jgi:hypothetical protein